MAEKLKETSQQNENEKKEEKKEKEFIAPDGGWGWVIVVGYALSNIVVIPLIQSFGLIFIDRFHDLGFNSTDITTLISINSWFGMIIGSKAQFLFVRGIFNGHLLKKFGYRKMAFAGISLFSTGFFLTGFSTEYFHFLIAWGMISSLGFTWLMASFSFALNSYFKVRRSHASGRASFLTGLGPVLMPLLISYLLKSFGLKWTIFLLTAINLNSFIGATLLQPVIWHKRSEPLILEEETSCWKKNLSCCKKKEEVKVLMVYEDKENSAVDTGEKDEEKPIEFHDTISLFGGESSISGSRRSLYRRPSATPSGKWSSQDYLQRLFVKPQEYKRSYSESNANKISKSVTRLDNDDHDDMLRSMLHLLDKPFEKEKTILASMESLSIEEDKADHKERQKPITNRRLVRPSITSIEEDYAEEIEALTASHEEEKEEDENEEKTCLRKIWSWIHENYDLDLLADPIYINITVGMSIAIIGELMFSLLTPFILDELGLDLDEKAQFMSVVAVADIISRYIAPYAGDLLKFHSRAMYVTALFLLFMTRGLMFLPTGFWGFMAVALALGLAKGVRTVYWALVIPDYVPLKKYPSAAAIQSLANGILLALSGPIIGAIISISGSYSNAIIACNVLTLVTVAMWYVEFGIIWFKNRKKMRAESAANAVVLGEGNPKNA